MFYLLLICLGSLLDGAFGAAASTPPDNKGLEFVLMFMENSKLGPSPVFKLELYCTTQEQKTVHVHITSPPGSTPVVDETFTVIDGQVHKTEIDTAYRMIGSDIGTKAIRVEADAEVACYGANKETLSNDVYLGLPVDALGTDYYAVAHSPAFLKTQFGVASTVDNTNVKVTLPAGNGPCDVDFQGKTYHAGDVINVQLQRFQTLQLQSKGDLSGAHIETNNPVAVFSGNIKTDIGNGTSQDHLVEQLVSSDRWGEKFVTAPIPGRTVGDVFKIIAREDNTQVTIPGRAPVTLNKGQVFTFELPSSQYHYIQSTKPIMLTQFVKSQQQPTEPADPSMIVIPPYEQFGSDYTFTTPEYSRPDYGNDPTFRYQNEFMVVTKKSDVQGLLLDGKPFPQTTWTDIPGTDLVGSFITLPHGAHTVRHSNPLSTFGGYLYGHAYHESYGFPTGMRTAVIYSSTCVPTPTVAGDGIDNDCDNRIDEELCPDNVDDDGDGKKDEDCVKTFPIDGIWGSWSGWSSQCSVTCGDGVVTRSRKCDAPAPKFGGKNCSGADQETKQCYSGQPCGLDVATLCAANSNAITPNPLNCAQYYDCRKTSPLGKLHLFECPYPQLFNNATLACDDFEKVNCGRRFEPMAPCEYDQNKCNGTDPNCKPCPQRLFSCVNLTDGRQAENVFSPEYKDCKGNRTMGQGKCVTGYFNAMAHRCMPHNPGSLSFYCRMHSTEKQAIPTNCAKFYNCAKPGATLDAKTDECTYPDLFSADTGQCENFTTVNCDTRMEPQAPCEYDQYKCSPTNVSCVCPDEHADCKAQSDGRDPWPGKMWGPKYADCKLNRTMSQGTCPTGQYFNPTLKQCTDTVKPNEISDVCKANPTMIFPDLQNCAKYIDCSASSSPLGKYILECSYPDLFSTTTGHCEKFDSVHCDKRMEPMAPCDYEKNKCAPGNTTCQCPDVLPSCVGKADGVQPIPTREWKPDYMTCNKNRTVLPTKKCNTGYFHPLQKKCVEDVAKPDAKPYCLANTNDVIPIPDNCAQYINCSYVVTMATASDPVQECKYPDLFSTQTMRCQDFNTVHCDKRHEPQAPCEYSGNQCAPGNTTCSCPDNLPSCVGKSDGDHTFPTRTWKPDYITCNKNRTVLPTKRCTKGYFHPVDEQCEEDVKRTDAVPYCQANPTAVVPMSDSCAEFINCTSLRSGAQGSDPVQECKYPDLFSTVTMSCQDFTTVQCHNRSEPQAPCEYKQNQCKPTDTNCVPCVDRLPSCVGKPDGNHAFTTREWKPDYITCNKNRTILPTKRCIKGYFHPVQEQCLENVAKPDAKSYCQANPGEMIHLPDNCAQYIDCTVVPRVGTAADPVHECTYPDLFSTLSMTCQHFTTVTCDIRPEPQAPCEYEHNKCAPGNTTCTCPENLPSCVGKPDGDHAFPTRMWKPDYITCDKNRTVLPTKRCTKGYFHPSKEICTEDVLRPDAKQYCQANPNDMIPTADNCAQYINCSVVTIGTGNDPIQECQYPQLFSRQTAHCQNFTTVTCDKRREPMAPCDYDQNLCVNLNIVGCEACPNRLPSCVGLSDGDQPFPTKLWTASFIHCYKNRTLGVDTCPSGAVFDPSTKSCTANIDRNNIDSYCLAYPTAVKANPLNCAQYYNCSANSASLGHHLFECRYPDLFSETTHRCEKFESVQCTNRTEPQAPCEYMENLCQPLDQSCQRCPDRLPSCVGLGDGIHAFPGKQWKPDYITCYKNRTVNITRCTDGYFHPINEVCTKDLQKRDSQPYCQANHNAVLSLPDSCAQFIDCTLYINGNAADPVQECRYPDLFSDVTLRCEKFESVSCDKRKEPMVPCQYEKNLCPTNAPGCTPCPDRLPSCVGTVDGASVFPGRLWQPDYITCYKNRTVLPINKCPTGYFHPVSNQCVNDVKKQDAKPFCQANPHAVVQMGDNCAHFIDCQVVLASPAADPVSECKYPDLFSTITMACQSFTTVKCDLRPEPQAPCEYKQNVCQPGNSSCENCPDRLPSCIGLTDGAQPFPTKLWTANYVQCYKNRTVAVTACHPGVVFDPNDQACVSDVPPSRMDSYCKANPTSIKVDPDNCAQYYNCSDPATPVGHFKMECKYPDLFSDISLKCGPFETINCKTRREPKAPCEYNKNQCAPGNATCICEENLPSCVGKADGDHAFPTRLWKSDFIVCYKERTISTKQCLNGYFHPKSEHCTETVDPTDAKPFCSANPRSVIPSPTNCAKLINCTAYTAGMASDPVQECPYPQLFSTTAMRCQEFTRVLCDNRTEPQAPCEYEQNLCSSNDPSCTSCPDRLPSCIGLTDGNHAFPSRLWKPEYFTCYQNRTVLPTKKCSKGYFHPIQQICTEHINDTEANQYCQANPYDTLPVPENCAKFYKCSATLQGQKVLQECTYPDLFSTLSMTCQDFTTVNCYKRPEPQAPCEYDQNLCSTGDPACKPCPDRLPSCVGLPDGDQPAAGHQWTDMYVRCYKNRTLEVKHCPNGAVFDPNKHICVSKIGSGDIAAFCQANPSSKKPHDTNCAQYYNCSDPQSRFGPYLHECTYPDLYSTVTLRCEQFESVPCGARHEPMPPCEYLQNLCNGSDTSCRPCSERLPSCVGLPDGMNPVPTKEWTSGYVECYKDRTVTSGQCATGYFHPVTKKCTEIVHRVDVKDFCRQNPSAVVAAADDCAQFYNCSQRASAIGDYISECQYPNLFSDLTMSCGSFRRVYCDARPEPQAPCQYEQNRCTQSDPACTPCPERLPSCIGLPDGAQPHPLHLWSERYIECFSNRTMAVRTCPIGSFFHPRQHQCRNKVDPVDIPDYCIVHVTEIITNPDNCAVFYNCSSPSNGYTSECNYPDLYDTSSGMCRDFTQVSCDTRPEPMAPCQYKQNLCPANNASCVPCDERYPSCVGLPDGRNPVPGHQWSSHFINCNKNRTTDVNTCTSGYFNPRLRACVTTVDKSDIPSYCVRHPDAIIPYPDNCAQYVNCSQMSAQIINIQECTYPDLFSSETMTCTKFTRVLCDKRMEPQAPCEYTQNQCAPGDTSCEPCHQRLPSCIGIQDGARPFPGREWTEYYMECYKNRTMALNTCSIGAVFDSIDLSCASNINKNVIQSFCRSNGHAIKEHSDNCAQYYNCSQPGSPLGPFLMECDYPKLFSAQLQSCVRFETAQCGSKTEPQAPCDYLHNLCSPQDLSCKPCQSRQPSCVGLSDGSQAFPGREWETDFITCYKNRTLSVQSCQRGYFHPQQRTCVEIINQVNIVSYCQVHKTDILGDPDNCARYFNCSDSKSSLGPFQGECRYPDLFSASLKTCVMFDNANCSNRPEPVNPCEYAQNQCDPKDTLCIPCKDRFPSCQGQPDGNNAKVGLLWKPDYVVCRKNRTISIEKCASGHFNPRTRSCETSLQPVDIVAYCQSNPSAAIPDPNTCSKYFSCPHALVTSGEPEECKYPDLFSVKSLKCEAFETVDCEGRREPQTPCEYSKNQCPFNDTGCIPCPVRLPSCNGLSDGLQTFGSQQWSGQYLQCYKNRTIAIKQCPQGSFFNPTTLHCTQNINNVDLPSFCSAYPSAIRPHPTNCAQYFDCSRAVFGGTPNRECPYPQLFDTAILTCKTFSDVNCGIRHEPKAPCEYIANQCLPSQSSCEPCTSRLPSCVGLTDGNQPASGLAWHQQYVVCNKERTDRVSVCPGTTVFNPIKKQCVDVKYITKYEIIDYCKTYPNAVFPDPDDCSRYYKCNTVTQAEASSQQCIYPDLFSPTENMCTSFNKVQCGSRPEPTSPCQYDQNKCPALDNACVPCHIRLPDCTGLPDGDNGVQGMLWSVNYVKCLTNRTVDVKRCSQGVFDPNIRACSDHIGPQHIKDLCFANKQAIVPHPTNCAQYFDCSKATTQFGHYLMECDYPMLFDQNMLQCRDFRSVTCGTKFEPKSPCQYFQNICAAGNVTCVPCSDRFPSCIGLPDGTNSIPGNEWSREYMTCSKDRTMATNTCPVGHYDPSLKTCSSDVNPANIPDYCKSNPGRVLADPSNCAHYYNCSSSTRTFGQECKYPQLFSEVTLACEDFQSVTCTSRPEPQAPCEYSQNQCQIGDRSCTPCLQRLPSCIGLPDGINAVAGRYWTDEYIQCLKNRTVVVQHCKTGIFDPTAKRCTETLDPNKINQVCQANPRAVFQDATNCAKYYDCSTPQGFALGRYFEKECPYPQLFSAVSMSCQDFTTVQCSTRPEPQAPCEYSQNQCVSSMNCQTCENRLPSCVGQVDGDNMYLGRPWSSEYTVCMKNRTMNITQCSRAMIFDPLSRKCVRNVEPAHIPDYCKVHPNDIIPNTRDAAQYFDCSNPSSPVGVPHLQECIYPDLFDVTSKTCKDFTTVPPDQRPTPQAPCDYERNHCSPTDFSCKPCPQRLHSCVGLPDGPNPIEGKLWDPEYISCHLNRTMATIKCSQGVFDPNRRQCMLQPTAAPGTLSIPEQCRLDPTKIIPHPGSCSLYYNCSKTVPSFGPIMPVQLEECKYPDMYSTIYKRCLDFQSVQCDQRHEVKAPCQYLQNQCDPNNATCLPCPERLPSCIGLPDGKNPIIGRYWSRDYVVCYKERTVDVSLCQNGIFDPTTRQCDNGIDDGNIDQYCRNHPTEKIADSDNCAKYYDCSAYAFRIGVSMPGDKYLNEECSYPDLFSTATKTCEPYHRVSCDNRPEPQAPCEYSQNLCPPGDTSCVSCSTRLPSCVGLPDGQQAVPGQEYSDTYLECKQNRTLAVKTCSIGFFDAGLHMCVTNINSANIEPYCKRNPGAILPHPTNCAWYYNCSVNGRTLQSVYPFDIEYVQECKYPDLFSSATMRCEDFQRVTCTGHFEPQTPCEYFKNRCDPSAVGCIPCPNRIPSCRTLPDGRQTIHNLYDGLEYLTDCYKNRTLNYKACSPGMTDCFVQTTTRVIQSTPSTTPRPVITIFPLHYTQPVTTGSQPITTAQPIQSGNPNSYCRQHPYDSIEDPNNCAKYYDCREIFTHSVISAKECPYPLLYHSVLRTCADFSIVQCQQRYEPQAPCEYSANQCQGPACVPCNDRLMSCVGLSDGNHAFNGQTMTTTYVRCQRNRTIATEQCSFGVFDPISRQCQMSIATATTAQPSTVDAYCASHPYDVLAESSSCAQYYSCPLANTRLGNHLMECPYPQLFDDFTKTCRDRIWVQCGQRPMPNSQCDYKLYECIGFGCLPCPGQVQTPQPTLPYMITAALTSPPNPTCIGKPDGLNPYPGRELTSFFIVCDQGSVIEIGNCILNKILDPVRRRCTDPGDPDVIDAYCQVNPGITIPSATNCAQYYDCGTTHSSLRHEPQECTYPQLFSTVDNTCKVFSDVQCGQRYEPVAPCDYHQNQCDAGSPGCIPCQQRMPSCQGRPDGLNPYPNSPGTPDYIVCDTGRTVQIARCSVGYFDPMYRQCRTLRDENS